MQQSLDPLLASFLRLFICQDADSKRKVIEEAPALLEPKTLRFLAATWDSAPDGARSRIARNHVALLQSCAQSGLDPTFDHLRENPTAFGRLDFEQILTATPEEKDQESLSTAVAMLEGASGGNMSSAHMALKILGQLAEEGDESRSVEMAARIDQNLGTALSILGKHESADYLPAAIGAYTRALDRLAPDTHERLRTLILLNRGVTYHALGSRTGLDNLHLALGDLLASLKVYKRDTDTKLWLTAKTALGNTLAQMSRFGDEDAGRWAIQHLSDTLTMYDREKSPHGWAQTQLNLGAAFAMVAGRFAPDLQLMAHQKFVLAETVFTEDVDPFHWAMLKHNQGMALAAAAEAGRNRDQLFGEAFEALDAAINCFGRIGAETSAVRATVEMANTWMAESQNRDVQAMGYALEGYEIAANAFAQLDDMDGLRMAISNLARTNRILGLKGDAAALEKAIGYYDDLIVFKDAKGDTDFQYGRALTLAALARNGTGDWEQPLAIYRSLIALRDQAQVGTDEHKRAIDTFGHLHIEAAWVLADRLGDYHGALEVLEDGRALVLKSQMGAVADEHAIKCSLPAMLQEPRTETVVVVFASELGGGMFVIPPDAIKLDGRHYVSLPKLTTVETSDISYIWYPAMRDLLGHLSVMSTEKLEERADLAVQKDASDRLDAVLAVLSELVTTPLLRRLEQLGVPQDTNLVLIPQGSLSIYPWAATWDDEGDQSLLDLYSTNLCASIEVWRRCKARARDCAAPQVFAGVFGPATAGAPRLPYAEAELPMLQQAFGRHGYDVSRCFKGEEATLENIRSACESAKYAHFSCHGVADNWHPQWSRLFLAGAEEVSAETVAKTFPDLPARLVSLSACNTGSIGVQRARDEHEGLASAFIGRGAAGVLTTLWPVSDAMAATLLTDFYEIHLDQGHEPPQALRRAMLNMRDSWRAVVAESHASRSAATGAEEGEGVYIDPSSPLFWAAFCFSGS